MLWTYDFCCSLKSNAIHMSKISYSVFWDFKIPNGTCPLFPLGPSIEHQVHYQIRQMHVHTAGQIP